MEPSIFTQKINAQKFLGSQVHKQIWFADLDDVDQRAEVGFRNGIDPVVRFSRIVRPKLSMKAGSVRISAGTRPQRRSTGGERGCISSGRAAGLTCHVLSIFLWEHS
jgi:hypothetical protein